MTTIPPASAVPTASPVTGGTPTAAAPATPAAPTGGNTAVLNQLPSGLQSAGPGMVITGVVVGVDNQGQILLQTNAGVIGLKTTATLAVGQQVSLQIQAAGSQLQAIILSTHSATSSSTPVATATVDVAAAAGEPLVTPADMIAPSVSTGSVVVATVIGPAAGGATGTAPAAAVPAGASTAPATAAAPPFSGSLSPAIASGSPAASATAAPTATSSVTPSPAPPSGPPNVVETVTPDASAPASQATPVAAEPPPGAAAPGTTVVTAPTVPAVATASVPLPSATVIASPATSGAPPSAAPSSLSLIAAQEATPSPSAPSAVATYAAASSTTTAAGASGLPAAPVATDLPAAPVGTQVPLRFVGVLPSLSQAASSAARGQLVATVVGRTPSGQTVIDTAVGRLAMSLPAANDVAPGTQLAFEIVALAGRAGAAAARPMALGGAGFATLGPEWPALNETMAALRAAAPAVAQQLLDLGLPRPDSVRFLGQILSWLADPKTDAVAVLGQSAVDALQHAGRGDLLSRLDTDLREAVRLNAASGDWQIFYVPILDTTELRQMRVFARRQKGGRKGRPSEARFVVEVEFEGLGPLQIDGLVHKPRLDLILRSHADLPGPLQSGISEVFAQTCVSAGLIGQIFFQAAPTFPVSPLEELTRQAGPGLSI